MPRYRFTVAIGEGELAESVARTLADADAAWKAAHAMIGEFLAASVDARLLTATIVVSDEAGEIVFELPFSEVVLVPPNRPGSLH